MGADTAASSDSAVRTSRRNTSSDGFSKPRQVKLLFMQASFIVSS